MKLLKFNSSRHRLQLENAGFATRIPANALILDAGAGSSPYHHLFSHAQYESADHIANKNPDVPTTYVCDLCSIPVPDNRYDFVILNQVLEHVPEPAETLQELYRVLKPAGQMIYSAPLFYEEHEAPHDYYRYTKYGVRHLFEKVGFEVTRLDWLEGYFGTVAYQLKTIGKYLPSKPSQIDCGLAGYAMVPFLLLTKVACRIASLIFHQLERKTKFTMAGYPKNYIAILKKPVSSEIRPEGVSIPPTASVA